MTRLGEAGGIAPAPPPGTVVSPVAVGGSEEGAVGLKGSSTLVGLHFESIATTALGLAGSVPIAGKVALEFVKIGFRDSAVLEDPHRFQLALASGIPANQAALDSGEQLFPQASSAAGSKACVMVFSSSEGFFVPVTTVVQLNGRRIVCGWYNGATTTGDAYVLLGVHRVLGGAGGGDPSFLSGEPVVDW